MRYPPKQLAIICCGLVLLWMGGFYTTWYAANLYAGYTYSTWPLWGFPLVFALLSTAILFLLLNKAGHSSQYKQLYQLHPSPMWIYEKQTLRFLSMNRAALQTYGYSEKEFRQMTIRDIYDESERDRLMDHIRQQGDDVQYHGIWQHHNKNGDTFFVEIYAHPGYYKGRKARIIFANNIDREVKTADVANELNKRYALLANMTNDAIYEWDLVTNRLTWNHGLSSVFGYNAGQLAVISADWWEQRLHPEEREHIMNLWHQFLKGNSRHFQEEYRFQCADGSYKYVRNRTYLISEAGMPLRLLGAIHDIDALMQVNRQLRTQNAALREIAWINSHEIRRPVVSILGIAQLFDKSNEYRLLNNQLVDWLHEATTQLDEVIHKIEQKVKGML